LSFLLSHNVARTLDTQNDMSFVHGSSTLHYITSFTLLYFTSLYFALLYTTTHKFTLPYFILLHFTLHDLTSHYLTLQYSTLLYIALPSAPGLSEWSERLSKQIKYRFISILGHCCHCCHCCHCSQRKSRDWKSTRPTFNRL